MEDFNRRPSVSSISSTSTTATNPNQQSNFLNPNSTGNSVNFSRLNQSRHFGNNPISNSTSNTNSPSHILNNMTTNTNTTNNSNSHNIPPPGLTFSNNQFGSGSLMNNITPWIEQQQQQHSGNNATTTNTTASAPSNSQPSATANSSSTPLSLIHHANLNGNGNTKTDSKLEKDPKRFNKPARSNSEEDDKSGNEFDIDNENNEDVDDERERNEDEDDDELIPTAIVIKNIPFAIKKEQLLDVMTKLNLPLPYAFNYHFDNGVFRGLAFANFNSSDETSMVVNILNGREIGGRKLRVEYKKMLPQLERERIEREKREKRGQLEEQHRSTSNASLASLYSISSVQNSKFNPMMNSLNPNNNNNVAGQAVNNQAGLNMSLSNSSYLHPETYTGTNTTNNQNNSLINTANNSPPNMNSLMSDRLYQSINPQTSSLNPLPPSIDFNDIEVLDIYTKLILFRDELPIHLPPQHTQSQQQQSSTQSMSYLHSELAFTLNNLSLSQRRIISVLSTWLGLIECSSNGLLLIKRNQHSVNMMNMNNGLNMNMMNMNMNSMNMNMMNMNDQLHRSISSASMINHFSSPSSTPLQPMSSHFTGGSTISQVTNQPSQSQQQQQTQIQSSQSTQGQPTMTNGLPKLMRSHSHGLVNTGNSTASVGISGRYRQQSPRNISQSQASSTQALAGTPAPTPTPTPTSAAHGHNNTLSNSNTPVSQTPFTGPSNTIPLTTSTLQQFQTQQQSQSQQPPSPRLHHSSSNVSLLRTARSQPLFQHSTPTPGQQTPSATGSNNPNNSNFLNLGLNLNNMSSSNISTSAAAFTNATPSQSNSQPYSPFFGSFNSNTTGVGATQQSAQLTGGSMMSSATATSATIGGHNPGSNFFGNHSNMNMNMNMMMGLNAGGNHKNDDLSVGLDNLSFER